MTYKEAREYFNYDQDTGELTWKKRPGMKTPIGAKAGCLNDSGYIVVRFKRVLYTVHRVIWLWVHGYWPEDCIDHINRDRGDNRLANLREVSRSCNMRNAKLRSDSSSGITGVSWYKREKAYSAEIKIAGKKEKLGLYKDLTSAVKARHEAEVKHKWPGCNNSTPTYQYLVAEGIL